ncbi:MAG TPA: outer membrane beta-barrel protein [Vicinamibacteria bacterium]|nr:outer membrane beta-barrel protein [Vicinamibacteria bacterium]
MIFRLAHVHVLTLMLFVFALSPIPARAQAHKFKLGGGAGFAVLKNPEIDHGRTAAVGGFFGLRFNDNLSFEAGFSFARSNRQFNENGEPIDQVQGIPAFGFETNRYHLDGSFVVHLGRRQPFHAFLLAGGGVVRRDEKRTDIFFTFDPVTNQILERREEVTLDTKEYEPTGHVGGGFDLYFLYNLAARVEFRQWLPQTTEKRTRMFFFAATYFF